MSKIVNLRQHRKRRARDDKREQAEHNRLRSGRTKAEKQRAADEREAGAKHLDQHRLDRDDA